jgi:hypothetical protein
VDGIQGGGHGRTAGPFHGDAHGCERRRRKGGKKEEKRGAGPVDDRLMCDAELAVDRRRVSWAKAGRKEMVGWLVGYGLHKEVEVSPLSVF